MQLVTDSAADISAEQRASLPIKIYTVPLSFTLDGQTYTDIESKKFYEMLDAAEGMPTTSQPSPVDFEELYRRVASETGDNEILSVHVSAGLSGTPNAARLAANTVEGEGINVHLVDTRTLSVMEGWQVEAAAKAIGAGQSVDQIRTLLDGIGEVTDGIFTLPTLKYLIHGGRIGHMKGLLASTLGIKPLIGVDRATGKYDQRGQVRTFKRALKAVADQIENRIPPGTKLRAQVLHAINLEGVDAVQKAIEAKYPVEWMPTVQIAPVLGAHTGAGLVGVGYAPAEKLPAMPA